MWTRARRNEQGLEAKREANGHKRLKSVRLHFKSVWTSQKRSFLDFKYKPCVRSGIQSNRTYSNIQPDGSSHLAAFFLDFLISWRPNLGLKQHLSPWGHPRAYILPWNSFRFASRLNKEERRRKEKRREGGDSREHGLEVFSFHGRLNFVSRVR